MNNGRIISAIRVAFRRDARLSAPCHFCGARQWRPCTWPDGKRRNVPHLSRVAMVTQR